MALCKISFVNSCRAGGLVRGSSLAELLLQISNRFNLEVGAIQLKVYGYTLDNEDDFKSVCNGAGVIELDLEERSFSTPSNVIDTNSSFSTLSDVPTSPIQSGSSINEIEITEQSTPASVSPTVPLMEDYYPIRDIIRNSGMDLYKADALFSRLDNGIVLSKQDRSIINRIVGKWLYTNKGINGMPKASELDKAAQSIVKHFPVTRDCNPEKKGWESWFDVKTKLGRLKTYVKDKRSTNKNNGAVVRNYNKRRLEDSMDEEDEDLVSMENFMKENELTCNNEQTMVKYHQGCFEIRKKWIFEKHPTATDIANRFPRLLDMKSAVDNDFKSLTDGWTIDEFSKKWLEVEEKILIEICHKNMALLQPCEFNPKVLLESFRDSSINIEMRNARSQAIFASLPVLFPPRPGKGKKGSAKPKIEDISRQLIRQFPENVSLQDAINQCQEDFMVQPGIVIIGSRRYVKIDLLPIKIVTGCMAESIGILLASYFVFNLSYSENFFMVFSFLEQLIKTACSEIPDSAVAKRRKSSNSIVITEMIDKIISRR